MKFRRIKRERKRSTHHNVQHFAFLGNFWGKKIRSEKIEGFTLSPRSTRNRVKQNGYLWSDGGGKSGKTWGRGSDWYKKEGEVEARETTTGSEGHRWATPSSSTPRAFFTKRRSSITSQPQEKRNRARMYDDFS